MLKCMNMFLRPYNVQVFQKKGNWFVIYMNENMTEIEVPFYNNMQIRVGV